MLQRHWSRPYNPCIANAFFKAGYVESRGRGTQKICESSEVHGTTQPEYVVHPEDFYGQIDSMASYSKIGFQSIIQSFINEALEMKIIDLLIENNKLSPMDIVNRLGYSRTSVQRTMKKLVENGIIERKGGKRFGFWEIHN